LDERIEDTQRRSASRTRSAIEAHRGHAAQLSKTNASRTRSAIVKDERIEDTQRNCQMSASRTRRMSASRTRSAVATPSEYDRTDRWRIVVPRTSGAGPAPRRATATIWRVIRGQHQSDNCGRRAATRSPAMIGSDVRLRNVQANQCDGRKRARRNVASALRILPRFVPGPGYPAGQPPKLAR
jgi:hypothetical protein